jgi:glucokinase
VISGHAIEGDDPLCRRALDLFVEAYGAVAGDVALTVGARGGVLVAGGIALRILPALVDGRFIRAFRDKGRMREYVERIPVRVILAEDAALRGAACVAARL